jgi:hypothetical protein
VPSSYRVMLHPADLLAFETYQDSLAADLADALHGHARSRGYTLTARPRVQLEASGEVSAGDIVIRAQPIAPPRERRGTNDRPPERLPARPQPASAAAPAGSPATSAYSAPSASLPKAVLAVRISGQPVSRVPVKSGTLRVGRALDNDLVLPDDRVSRHHGQFSVRLGTLVYSDLNSTNGSYLNGSRVTEIALGPGDVLQLGSSTLAIEQGD